MDMPAFTVEVFVGAGEDALGAAMEVAKAAEECCVAASDDPSFVMITTELREQGLVKLVQFEDAGAAARFRSRMQQQPGRKHTNRG